MKSILLLTNRIPFPLNDGGNKAVYNSIEILLSSGYNVTLLCFNTSKHYFNTEKLPPLFKDLDSLYTVYLDNRISPIGALKQLILNRSYHISRFITKEFSEKLKNVITAKKYDCVLLEGLFMAPYIDEIRSLTQAPIIYRQHNIEFKIWETKSIEEKNPIKKQYYKILSKQLKAFEINVIKSLSIVCPISKVDMEINQSINPHLIQFYWPYAPKSMINFAIQNIYSEAPKFYHIGAMDWAPNQSAVDRLLYDIFPKILKRLPTANLFIAGRLMPSSYLSLNQTNVNVLGEVEDSFEFQRDKHILLIPLESASGQRIKFIEAMQLKKCIISTDIGKSDIEAIDGVHYLKANCTEEFLSQVIKVCSNPELYNSVCNNAYKLYLEKYSFEAQCKRINSFINNL